jgi:geranylgeranylglycerol-phosphate geranylgeranyltransferase
MRKLTALIRLIRPLNFFITFFVITVGYILAAQADISMFILFSASLSGAFTAAAGNIVNDIFDIESDKINHPERPLASKVISYNAAKSLWFLLTLISFIVSSLVSISSFLIVLFVHILLILYSFKLKSNPVAGNLLIALLTSSAFIYGGFAAGYPERTIIPAVFAFLINYIRELVKDMQDIKGDLHTGTITLPGRYGLKNTKRIIFIFISFLLLFTLYPFATEYFKIEFFIIMMLIVNPLLVYTFKLLRSSEDEAALKKVSGILKFNMAAGLLAIYLGI